MGEAEPRALQEGEVDRLRLPYRPLLAEPGFVILHCHVTKLELEAVAGRARPCRPPGKSSARSAQGQRSYLNARRNPRDAAMARLSR